MSLSAAVIDALLEAGATREQLAAAMKASIAEAEQKKTEKRGKDAARQRRSRASRNVTVTPCDDADPSPNEYISNPHPVPPVEVRTSTAPRGRSDRGSKIPETWEAPTIAELSTEARALAERWPAAAYRAEAEAFRNYWLGESAAKARKSDWNRAWANRIVAVNGRVMREAKFAGTGNAVGTAAKRSMTVDELRNAIRFAEDHGDHERAAECKAQLQRLKAEARPPPTPIGNIISKTAAGMRAGHG